MGIAHSLKNSMRIWLDKEEAEKLFAEICQEMSLL